MKQILLATTNKSKLLPFRLAWENAGFNDKYQLLTFNDIEKKDFDVDEDTGSFESDALKKALEYAEFYKIPTISLDRGIEIEALENWPGTKTKEVIYGDDKVVYEDIHKFVNKSITDVAKENCEMILNKLEGRERTMYSVYGIAFSFPDRNSVSETVRVKGKVNDKLNITKIGHAFDWFFIPEGYNKTFSQFTENEYLDFAANTLWTFPKKIQDFILKNY